MERITGRAERITDREGKTEGEGEWRDRQREGVKRILEGEEGVERIRGGVECRERGVDREIT